MPEWEPERNLEKSDFTPGPGMDPRAYRQPPQLDEPDYAEKRLAFERRQREVRFPGESQAH